MIKVLNLRSGFVPGGIEILLLNLFNHQQDKIQFHYIIMKESDLIYELNSETNKYYRYIRKNYIDFNVLKSIIKLIRKEKIKHIHTHQLLELIYALIIKIFSPSIKVYLTIHGVYKPKWIEIFEKILIKHTKITFTVSFSAKEILTKKGYSPNQIQVLYNAVNTPKALTEEDKITFYNSIEYTKGDVIIGMIGNFRPEKDHFTLIKAFNKLRHKYPSLKLILIGRTNNELMNYRNFILENKLTNVYLLGSLNHANRYIPLFNIFVLSSKLETFGISVFEAILAKVPVITSDIPVFKELSKNGKYFTLFKKGDDAHLSKKIELLLLAYNTPLFNKRINQSFLYAKSKFGYENYINKLFSFYSSQEI